MFKLINNDKIFTVFDIGFGKIACLSFRIENDQPKIIGMDHQKSVGLDNFCLKDSEKLSCTLEKIVKNSLGKNFKKKTIYFFQILQTLIYSKKKIYV